MHVLSCLPRLQIVRVLASPNKGEVEPNAINKTPQILNTGDVLHLLHLKNNSGTKLGTFRRKARSDTAATEEQVIPDTRKAP